ncbi:MAG TPA: PQQ-dependent sugar dehydrogenase, partial [Methylomirabilota bacterium]|nr:PQQ-dependent sugar dehydrogenase [Methylomirabilota bacterium]
MNKRLAAIVFIVLLILAVLSIFFSIKIKKFYGRPLATGANLPTASPFVPPTDIPAVSVVADNLEVPWSLVFLPDRSILFTERPGRVRLINPEGKLQQEPLLTIPVNAVSEGGLLGITIDPQFATSKFVYVYYTYANTSGNTLNRVVRYTFAKTTLTDPKMLVDAIPGNADHNGGRIKFGPDGYLYVTTGDAQNPSHAQDTSSLAGKILRMTTDGKPAPGNPFNTLIYSYGHRNPQGLAWDDKGQLWATEHGRSGNLSGLDELNLIQAGKNYGWPIIQGDEKKAGMITPVINSGPTTTWAPSGAAFHKGSIFFGG